MAPVFLEHPSSLEHDTGGHPERADRITAILAELEREGWLGLRRLRSEPASRAALEAVHPAAYIDHIARFSQSGGGHLDLDTVLSAGSYDAALHAAGGATGLVARLLGGEASCGLSVHRPPGHHATRDRAMGFCLFNNVAVAARHALEACGCERVMILDWDVHHGNGTNDIFHESDRVLFVSIHQSPLYPGTGSSRDAGSGPGLGYTVNLPVPAGSGDETFLSLVEHVAVPLGRRFRPQLIIVSAGYDAHRDDPLADCAVTEAGYAAMTRAMSSLAHALEAPLALVLEGGYGLAGLARSVAATARALGEAPGDEAPVGALTPAAREARARLARFWPELA